MSLTWKFFILVCTFSLLTVAVNSVQNAVTLKEFLESKAREDLVEKAKDMSANMNNILTNWTGQMLLVTKSIISDDKLKPKMVLNFLESNNNFIAFALIDQKGSSLKVTYSKIRDKLPSELKRKKFKSRYLKLQ